MINHEHVSYKNRSEMLRKVRKGSRKKCRRKKEGEREKRSERWRKSYLLGDVHLDQCIHSQLILLALLLLPKMLGTKK